VELEAWTRAQYGTGGLNSEPSSSGGGIDRDNATNSIPKFCMQDLIELGFTESESKYAYECAESIEGAVELILNRQADRAARTDEEKSV